MQCTMADKLDRLIQEKQAEIDRINREIESLAKRHERQLIELEALKQAASLRPGAATERKGGRQAGDISQEWRKVLATLFEDCENSQYEEIAKVALRHGIETKMANVRERVRIMVENGLLTGDPTKGFTVTSKAAERFKLTKKPAAQDAEPSPSGGH